MKPFTLAEIKNSAMRLDSKFELGEYVIRGPQENLMELESWLAFSSVAAQLHHEGYVMVPPAEFAKSYGLSLAEVMEKIEKEGTLFALMHATHDATFLLVPMQEREEVPAPSE